MNRKGFTLLELLVVMAIIFLLMGVVLAGWNAARNRALELKTRRQIEQIKTSLTAYYGDYGALPSDPGGETDEDFTAIMRGGNRRGYTYMDFHERSRGMRDHWGNFYQYTIDPGTDTVRVWSNGATASTDDDVRSWQE